MERVWNGREERLDLVLKEIFTDLSRERIKSIIETGKVSVNGKVIRKPSFKIKDGFYISIEDITFEDNNLQPYDLPVEIVYEDKSILVVNKPPGLVVHPAPSVKGPTLVNALVGKTELAPISKERPGIVHRLDKDTSGLMVVAKTFQSYDNLVKQMQERKIKKEYIAVVHGIVKSGTINVPIGRSRLDRTKMVVSPSGRLAISHYELLEVIGSYSLIRVRIETGRTHQIRVHLSYIGHPIVGDRVYGRKEDESLISRQALHSSHLSFSHPVSGEPLDFYSPIPDDIENLLERLRRQIE